jgi:endonuclease/exonuclease/phosphatase family metal-dependent hydrolase
MSLNIEKDKHLDRILNFILKNNIDILLFQEVILSDVPKIEKILSMRGYSALMKRLIKDNVTYFIGVSTLSLLPITNYYFRYYRGSENSCYPSTIDSPINTSQVLIITNFELNGISFCLVNTHFTWSPHGKEDDLQRIDLKKLLLQLKKIPDFVLCGDLNAPRGRIIFDTIASIYKDNIPDNVITTIDKNLHRAGTLELVVDCIFSTPKYTVKNVQLVEGLSDHLGIMADIYPS